MPSKIQGVSRGLTKDTVRSVPTCLKDAQESAAGLLKSPPCAYLTVTTQPSHVSCTSRTRESISGPCERPSLICLVHISLLSMCLLRHELLYSAMRPPACHAGHFNPPPPLPPTISLQPVRFFRGAHVSSPSAAQTVPSTSAIPLCLGHLLVDS